MKIPLDSRQMQKSYLLFGDIDGKIDQATFRRKVEEHLKKNGGGLCEIYTTRNGFHFKMRTRAPVHILDRAAFLCKVGTDPLFVARLLETGTQTLFSTRRGTPNETFLTSITV